MGGFFQNAEKGGFSPLGGQLEALKEVGKKEKEEENKKRRKRRHMSLKKGTFSNVVKNKRALFREKGLFHKENGLFHKENGIFSPPVLNLK